MKRYIIFAACVLFLISQSAYAETLLSFDTASRTAVLSGNADSGRVKSFVSFAVIPCGTDAENALINDNTLENVFYKTAQTDKDGNFKTEFSLPDSLENGQYSIISYDTSGKNINRVGLVNDDFLQDLTLINSAGSPSEMNEILKSLTDYNMDEEVLETLGNNIARYLYNSKPEPGYSKEGFVKTYNMGEGLARLEAGSITLGEFLREYSAYTDVNYNDTYGILSDAGKAEAEKLLKKELSLINGDFPAVYQRIFEISEIKGSTSADELKSNYLKSAADRKRPLSDYNKLGTYSKESVFLSMLSSIGSKNSLAEIDALFDECVKEQTPAAGGQTGGGGKTSAANKGSSAVSNSVPVTPPEKVKTGVFPDVKGHWAEEAIKELYEKGVINGFEDGSFCPDNAVTRAEFVKIMCKMFGLSGKGECSFNDVTSKDWFYDAVCTGEKYGLITGDDKGGFNPHKAITREDAAVILQRFLKLGTGSDINFADSEKISDYAENAVKALACAGIIKGYDDNTIKPDGEITRAEAAAVILRAGRHLQPSDGQAL